MVKHRVLPKFLASVLFSILAIEPAASQPSCRQVLCPGGHDWAEGWYPDCRCNGEPVEDVDIPEPENPTCELHFGCPDSLVGVGTWPECVCRGADSPRPRNPGDGLGDPASFNPGAGGAATCSQFFECPPRYHMDVGKDGVGCICK